jgi:PAS domain S-box-containing protein
MSAIVESSNDAIVGTGVDGRITTWNRGAQKLFGYAAEEIIGQPVSLLEPESAPGGTHAWVAEALEKVRAGRSADCTSEVARRRKDGTSIDVLLSVSPILDLGGTLGGVSLIARDITERKRAERALAERARLAALRADIGVALARSEELRSILQHCTEIVVEHLRVALARVWTLGPSAQTLELQASAGSFTHPDGPGSRVPPGELAVARIAQTRQPLFASDVTRDPRAGDYEWAEREGMVAFAGYPLVVSDRVVGVLAVFAREELPRSVVDDLGSLTYEIAQCVERKRAEEASQRYARELESANEELRELVTYRQRAEEEAREGVERRDRFLAILSHELRNPLAAVLNAANLLESASESGEVLRHAQGAIRRQSRQMARLLDDLLDVSRITRNRIDIRRQVVDVCDSARDAVDAVRPMCDGRGHELRADLPGEPLWIDGDPARLQQIQVNLLANAIKYTPPGGQIRLSVRREGEEVVLRVRDSGVGIPPAMHEKVFELFVQLDGAVGNSDGGMGVGLTLVRALVGLHGGTVTANSGGDGSGSEFVVRLPAAKGPHRMDAPQAPASDLAGVRVLVVEDNEDIRTTTVELLKLVGCDAAAAEDGPRGIEAIGRNAPEVAIIDIGMPGMDGYEVARRVRELPDSESVLLIAVTGFGQEDDRTRALGAGFNAHLVKPIDLNQLSATVTRLRKAPRGHQPGESG